MEGAEDVIDVESDPQNVSDASQEAGKLAEKKKSHKGTPKKGEYSGYSNRWTKSDAAAEKTDAKTGAEITDTAYNEKVKVMKESDQELEEAKATIEALRQDLQEVNLLNAKYLYMNKLFKSKTLSESQKVKVINALDRATNVAEVKNTYETLKESFEAKKQLKESIGFASQAAGVAPKGNIVDADPFINRWQKLAGINK